jgi:hypothetical protein
MKPDEDCTELEAAEVEEFVHLTVEAMAPMLEGLFKAIGEDGSEFSEIGAFTGILGSTFNKMKERGYSLTEMLQMSAHTCVDVFSDKSGMH